MATTSANEIAEGIRPMHTDLFELLLASGRAFTILPDGSIQVPAATARCTSPTCPTVDGDGDGDGDVTTNLPNDLPTAVTTPDECSDGDVGDVGDVVGDVGDDDLPKTLQAVLALFAQHPVLDAPIVRDALNITLKAAQHRLERLAAKRKAVTRDKKGHYTLAPESRTVRQRTMRRGCTAWWGC